MKKISILLLSGAILFGGGSCKKYLNVNTNPNAATGVPAYQVIDQTIVATANTLEQYSDYGGQVGGYMANAGGYGGFGIIWTYDYGTGDLTNLWNSSYSTLEDAQSVINSTTTDPTQANYLAMAQIIKAYNTQMLVDQYNDIPYSQAFQGASNITPKYDSASAVYQQLANLLDSAINEINAASGAVYQTGADPLFGGNMTLWKQFANTIKLRLIVRASAAMTFTNTTFSSDGFLTTDALVNPGFQQASGQTNPGWGDQVVSYTGAAADRAYCPATYVFGFYNGAKLNDSWRGATIFHDFPVSVYGQLGATSGTPSDPGVTGAWYTGSDTASGTSLGNALGVYKGPNAGYPLMTAAESYFLQAEAYQRGILTTGLTDAQAFQAGILASFNYLYELPSGTLQSGYDPTTDAAAYAAANSGSYLVNYSLATTPAQKLEAIITQKYIALNMINGSEAWNEYRRTGYPACASVALNNPYGSFASTQSTAPASNKFLPTRIQYPASEYEYNAGNVPQNISDFTSKIFWAQ